MPLNPEEQIQKAIFEWAEWTQRQMYPELRWLFHIPNGGKRTKIEAAIFKLLGVKKGVSDLCLPVRRGGYCGLYIELKTEDGTVSAEQQDFLDFVKEQGYYAEVCRSASVAISLIEAYLNYRKN